MEVAHVAHTHWERSLINTRATHSREANEETPNERECFLIYLHTQLLATPLLSYIQHKQKNIFLYESERERELPSCGFLMDARILKSAINQGDDCLNATQREMNKTSINSRMFYFSHIFYSFHIRRRRRGFTIPPSPVVRNLSSAKNLSCVACGGEWRPPSRLQNSSWICSARAAVISFRPAPLLLVVKSMGQCFKKKRRKKPKKRRWSRRKALLGSSPAQKRRRAALSERALPLYYATRTNNFFLFFK